MAIISLNYATDIRGKLGGVALQKVRNVLVIKKCPNRPLVTIPRISGGYTNWRSAWASVTKLWGSIGATNQGLWNVSYLTTIQRYNAVGGLYYWTGFNAFCYCNAHLLILGLPPITAPVSPTANTPIFSFAPSMVGGNPGTGSMSFLASPTDANLYHMAFISGPYSISTESPKNRWKYAFRIQPGGTSPGSMNYGLAHGFGPVITGMKYFIKLVAVEKNSGYATVIGIVTCVAT